MNTDLLIKVCGMRDRENILDVLELRPDFLGMIFYPPSKRFIGEDPSALRQSGLDQDEKVLKTGVFVDADLSELLKKISDFNLNAVQLHGAESVAYCRNLKKSRSHMLHPQVSNYPASKNILKVIKAFGIDSEFDWKVINEYREVVDFVLFDTRTPAHGGSGRKFDWSLLEQYNDEIPYFLSGGIGEEDLPHIMNLADRDKRLVGVDLNSKYEIRPGYKAVEKLKTTFKLLRDER